MPGRLFVISGPSGAGKSTIVNELKKLAPDVFVSISATTRPPRPGEKDGQNYYFMTVDEFIKLAEEGKFLEWAEVHGNYYGTPEAPIKEQLEKGKSVILEIDVQGALQVRKKYPDSVLIFIEPPDFKELVERLKKRSSDDEETIARRLENARYEMALASEYNYRVVNDDLTKAVKEVLRIIEKERSVSSDNQT